jgi:hypothetical protein
MKFIKLILITLLVTSCGKFTKDENIFDSDKLIGKYKVDITPIIKEATKESKKTDGANKLANGLLSMVFSSMEIEINFYENNKGIMSFEGGAVDFATAFSDEKIDKIHEFDYKVENDSVLYMKSPKDKNYNKWAIVRKFSQNYDFLQFLIIENGKEKVFFNLKKVTE